MQVTRKQIVSILLVAVLSVAVIQVQGVKAASSELSISPTSYRTQFGGSNGSPVSVMGVMDQSGVEDNPQAYVSFTTPNIFYTGLHTFYLPTGTTRTSITSMKMMVNYKGPVSATQTWTWYMYNFTKRVWTVIGSNSGVTTADTWSSIEFAVITPVEFISALGEIRVMLRSSNTTEDAKIDYEVLVLNTDTSPTPTTTPVTSTPTTPVPTITVTQTPSPTNAYYVSTSGNDINPGTLSKPWKTIKKALNTLRAGDTLVIRGGQYNGITAGWYFKNSGNATQPITVTNFPGEQVVLRITTTTISGNYVFKCTPTSRVTPKADYIRILGSDVSPRQLSNGVISKKGIVMQGLVGEQAAAIMSIDCDYWEVAGVDFVDVAYGIFTRKINNGKNSADNWNVHDNRVYGYYRESGMQFNGNSNRIENNEIYKVSNRLDTTYGCQLLNLLGNKNIVRGNVLSRLGSTANCIGILFEWDLSDGNLIENNRISDVPRGISLQGGDGNIIRNNTITGTGSGVAVIAHSYSESVTAWPCNFSFFMPLPGDITNPDYLYYYPHDCHSKNNQILGNTISGFDVAWQMSPVSDDSNVFLDNVVAYFDYLSVLPVGLKENLE